MSFQTPRICWEALLSPWPHAISYILWQSSFSYTSRIKIKQWFCFVFFVALLLCPTPVFLAFGHPYSIHPHSFPWQTYTHSFPWQTHTHSFLFNIMRTVAFELLNKKFDDQYTFDLQGYVSSLLLSRKCSIDSRMYRWFRASSWLFMILIAIWKQSTEASKIHRSLDISISGWNYSGWCGWPVLVSFT
jgi:hypothetical protein